MREIPKSSEFLDLWVLAGTDGLAEGDIITMGNKENPVRDWRTGIPIPSEQKFRVRIKLEN